MATGLVACGRFTLLKSSKSEVSAEKGAQGHKRLSAVLKVGEYSFTQGWASFGIALPQGKNTSSIQIGDLETQTDVKTTWPDGSTRFAIVTAKIPEDGTYVLNAGVEPSKHTFTRSAPTAVVAFNIAGNIYRAVLPATLSSDKWLAGAVVNESRAKVVPMDGGNNPHPYLEVIFDVRTFNDGASRVDVTVENVLNKVGATVIPYNVDITVNGEVVFHQESVQHYYLTRWRKVFDQGTTAAKITPDLESFYEAKAIPKYLPSIANITLQPTGDGFAILGNGVLKTYMGEPGGRPEIAPYPDWTARYLVHKGQTQREFVLKSGDLYASWPVHLLELDEQMVSIDQRPYFWFDYRGVLPNKPQGNLGATGPLAPDAAHQPSVVYIPYLLTGERFYLDELKYWANYTLLATWQDVPGSKFLTRGKDLGLLQGNQVRGIGWGLRNIVDATAYLPDSDTWKSYFTAKIQNNLDWLDNYAVTNTNPLGSSFENKRPENNDSGYVVVALWEQNYLAWSLDHANKQGFKGGLLLRDKIAKFQLNLFTSPDYPKEYAAPYTLAVGTRPPDVAPIYFTSLAQVYYETYSKIGRAPAPFKGYYGSDARLMLLIGMENNWPGAKAAYDWLNPIITQEIYLYGTSDLGYRSGWAILP